MNIKWFPYDAFVVETKDPVQEIVRKISSHIGKRNFWYPLRKKGEKAFEGRIAESGFTLLPIVSYHNSFLPVIIGRIDPRPDGAAVFVRMKLHGYTMTMMVVILIVALYINLSLYAGSEVKEPALWILGVPGIVGLAMYLMATFGFSYEAERYKKLIIEILTD